MNTSWKNILQLSLTDTASLTDQIASAIRRQIMKGLLQPGTSLPGSRQLADELGVNRKTVVFAYESLLAEGWIETRYKAGTFVAHNLPTQRSTPIVPKQEANFSFKKYAPTNRFDETGQLPVINFNEGTPDTRLAPLAEIARAYRRVFQQKGRWGLLGYGSEMGEEKLIETLSLSLARDRGLTIQPGALCITRGSQMALYLAILVLVQPGDKVVMEWPGYAPVMQLFRNAGASILPLRILPDGPDLDQLEDLCKQHRIKAVYTTPHHQFPSTVPMKAAARQRLLELSVRNKFAVIEDDYDHDYHFGAGNNLALASHDMAMNVIYISSLSKLIAPAVRIGYIAGPPAFMESLAHLRVHVDRQGDRIMERAVADLMEDGTLRRHAKKAVAVYESRRDLTLDLLQQHLGDEIIVQRPEGGLACWVQFPRTTALSAFLEAMRQKQVHAISPQYFYWQGRTSPHFRLGYGSLTEAELETGITRLAAAYQLSKR